MTFKTVTIEEFVGRRQKVFAAMSDNSVAVFPAAKELTRSRDTEFPFRQNSDFYYLTGFAEPDAWLFLEKQNGEQSSTLVCREKDKLAEIWQGRRVGKDNAKVQYQFDHAEDENSLTDVMRQTINGKTTLYFGQGEYEFADELVFNTLNQLRQAPKKGWKCPGNIVDIRPVVHDLRLIKSAAEIAVMTKAAEISAQAHKRAMVFSAKQTKTKQTVTEYQLEAELHHEFAMQGARHPAYGTIVGSGDNACILHYTENQDDINANELVLIDAGCELEGYAADITRTFPAGGKFTAEQKALYDVVLTAQLEVLNFIKPGVTLKQLSDIAVKEITKGLVDLGILQGEVESLIEQQAHRAYYMHGLCHWLGLDVHDVGDYIQAGTERPLEPGMVFTVEPGIYIDQDAKCDSKWHGLGIRIEDNILISQNGYTNLTAGVPKTVAEIEALMAV